MKQKFSAFIGCLLFLAVSASAQTQAPAQTTQDKPVNTVGTDKPLPVAQFYEGGQTALFDFIQQNLVYPPLAKRNRIGGQCIISFTLNADGSTANHKVTKNVGGGCGEEALRVVKLLKFNAPGYASNTSIPINFKL